MVPEVDLFLVKSIRDSFETLMDVIYSFSIHLLAHARVLDIDGTGTTIPVVKNPDRFHLWFWIY